MRTTVDIDHSLLERMRDLAHDQGISFKAVLNRTLRRGLEAPSPLSEPYTCPAFPMGPPLRALDKALALADSLEDEESARELSERR